VITAVHPGPEPIDKLSPASRDAATSKHPSLPAHRPNLSSPTSHLPQKDSPDSTAQSNVHQLYRRLAIITSQSGPSLLPDHQGHAPLAAEAEIQRNQPPRDLRAQGSQHQLLYSMIKSTSLATQTSGSRSCSRRTPNRNTRLVRSGNAISKPLPYRGPYSRFLLSNQYGASSQVRCPHTNHGNKPAPKVQPLTVQDGESSRPFVAIKHDDKVQA
jgi:hypothetical protein